VSVFLKQTQLNAVLRSCHPGTAVGLGSIYLSTAVGLGSIYLSTAVDLGSIYLSELDASKSVKH
jgi:hypothetical protein